MRIDEQTQEPAERLALNLGVGDGGRTHNHLIHSQVLRH